MDINWYPGHMAKAKRLVKENLKLVDIVIEVLDARIPASSRNPDIGSITGQIPGLVILNKCDLANPAVTALWKRVYSAEGHKAVAVDSTSSRGIREIPVIIRRMAQPKMKHLVASGRRSRPVRCMVLGIPNVGKSLFINKLVGRRVTRTGEKPGLTRGQQWIRVAEQIELLDTPGILWPKLDDPETAFRLAVTGAIKEEIFDPVEIAGKLLSRLVAVDADLVGKRYRLECLPGEPGALLEAIGAKRGLFVTGGYVDNLKSARLVIKEFREGKLGRHTLDEPGF
jgi:ribosome biogenesis GTPase A